MAVPRAWLTGNDVTTGRHPGYPDLRDRVYAVPPRHALMVAAAAVRTLPRWTVTEVDFAAGTLRAEVRTRIGGFIDDVIIQVSSLPGKEAHTARVNVRSRSRMGRADLGENARHIRALQRAMDARLPR
jgi:uncharacterized protein (DUF1499 family)